MTEKLKVALAFLGDHCQRNNIELVQRAPLVETTAEVVIVETDSGQYGSVGINQNGELACFCVDPAKYKWAKLEGFSEEEIYTLLESEVVKEVSLEAMASIFVGASL